MSWILKRENEFCVRLYAVVDNESDERVVFLNYLIFFTRKEMVRFFTLYYADFIFINSPNQKFYE